MLIVGEGAAGGKVNSPRLDSCEVENWLFLEAPLLPSLPAAERTTDKYGPRAFKRQLFATNGMRDRERGALFTVGHSHIISHAQKETPDLCISTVLTRVKIAFDGVHVSQTQPPQITYRGAGV